MIASILIFFLFFVILFSEFYCCECQWNNENANAVLRHTLNNHKNVWGNKFFVLRKKKKRNKLGLTKYEDIEFNQKLLDIHHKLEAGYFIDVNTSTREVLFTPPYPGTYSIYNISLWVSTTANSSQVVEHS